MGMLKTCKESGLANGLCLVAAGFIGSIVMATNANAFFNGDSTTSLEPTTTLHYNTGGNASGKFKMILEAEGDALTHGVGDSNNNLTLDMKEAIQEYTNNYPENYWY